MIGSERKEAAGGGHAKHTNTPSASNEAGAVDRPRTASRDRRAVRSVDLTDEDIAAIEASEMALGFEHLNAEADDV